MKLALSLVFLSFLLSAEVLAEKALPNQVFADKPSPDVCGMDQFQLSMVPTKNTQEQRVEMKPLVDLIAGELGIPVQVLPASSYESVVDAVTSGVADMVVLGPAAYIMASHREPGLEPFASLTMKGGAFTPEGSFYYSVLVVTADSDFQKPQDLRGASVAMSDPASTSGNLIPRASFPGVTGGEFDTFFSAWTYAGGHDRALDALLSGRVDSAFVASTRVDEYVRRGVVAESELRVLWQSSPLHYDPFVFSAQLCESLKARVRELMKTPSPLLSRYLTNIGARGVTPVSHADYEILDHLILPR